MKPLIGIIGNSFDNPIVEHANLPINYTPKGYTNAVHAAGGLPLIIPLVNEDNITEIVARFDGLVFAGGQDVSPIFYGQEPHPKLGSLNYQRDLVEIALIKAAFAKGLPILGICRGLQVINVALGGSLYQDLSEYPNWSVKHQQFGTAWAMPTHSIKVEPANPLHDIFGDTGLVNSLHHQAIKDLAPGLQALATSADGLVEAVTNKQQNLLAVQWHPEAQFEDFPEALAIFAWLIQASQAKD